MEDDGLICPEVGRWAETKFRLIALCELFPTGMKNKWEQRVYTDLYAGAALPSMLRHLRACSCRRPARALAKPAVATMNGGNRLDHMNLFSRYSRSPRTNETVPLDGSADIAHGRIAVLACSARSWVWELNTRIPVIACVTKPVLLTVIS